MAGRAVAIFLIYIGYIIVCFAQESSSTISLSLSSTSTQTIRGIGASGAWWPLDLYHYPTEVKNKAAELLFSENGLRLTSYRYNLGGGGVFVGNPSRAPETFFVSPGVYNFSADPQGVFFLRKAAEANVPVLTAFVNSAPPYFTSNDRSCGGEIVNATVPGYAQYVADVVGHWRSQDVHITHISPMNEPDDTFGSGPDTPCGQEGMEVTPNQRSLVVNTLRQALNNASLQDVGIMSDESSATGNFIPEAPTWLPDSGAALAAISHHQYSFADDQQVALLGETGRNLSGGKETWFTEICCFAASDSSLASDPAAPLTYSGGFDPTMVGGLQMASLIYQAFTQTLDAHFDWWLALSSGLGCDPTASGAENCTTTYNPNGWNDGLLYYDPNYATNGNYELYTTKRYFVMKHFTQFINYGSIRYDVEVQSNTTATSSGSSSLRGLAFKTDAATQTKGKKTGLELEDAASGWSLLIMNLGTNNITVGLPENNGRWTRVVRTSPDDDWTDLGGVEKADEGIILPGLSITSFLSEAA